MKAKHTYWHPRAMLKTSAWNDHGICDIPYDIWYYVIFQKGVGHRTRKCVCVCDLFIFSWWGLEIEKGQITVTWERTWQVTTVSETLDPESYCGTQLYVFVQTWNIPLTKKPFKNSIKILPWPLWDPWQACGIMGHLWSTSDIQVPPIGLPGFTLQDFQWSIYLL